MAEQREYAALPYEYLEEMEELNDAEFGRLARALLRYSMTGEPIALSGNERFYARRVMNREDRYQENFKTLSEKRKESGKKGGSKKKQPEEPESDSEQEQASVSKGKQTEANPSKGKQTEANASKTTYTKTKAKAKAYTNLSPDGESIGAVRLPVFGTEELNSAVSDWVSYKAERGDSCTPTELQALESVVRSKSAQYGEHAVADCIRIAMSNGWKGVRYESLEQKRGNRRNAAPAPSRYEVDQSAREDMERMKRILEEMEREENESCT